MLRPNAEFDRRGVGAARLDADTRAVRPPGRTTLGRPAVRRGDLDGEEIHARRADEGGDELVRRTVVKLERRADLRDSSLVENDDPVGESHRLGLVVRDIDHRRAEIGVELGEFEAHLHPAAWRRDWTKARRTGRPRACAPARGRSPPAGAARPKARPGGDRDRARAAGCARLRACARSGPFSAAPATDSEKAMFCLHRHVRVERVGLEHHRDPPLRRRRHRSRRRRR